MIGAPLLSVSDCRPHRTPLAAFADGPVADTAEPVAAEPCIPGADPDSLDLDAVPGHLADLERQAAELRRVGANYAASLVERKIKRERESDGDDLDAVGHG